MNRLSDEEFRAGMKERAGLAEDILKTFLPLEKGMQKTLLEAVNYSVLGGGKRLRPVFLLESYRSFATERDEDSEDSVKAFMAAIEMIHNYSLVHDDLPAMDNDLYRRGRKTTHAVYGPGMATLAGDALLNLAFETVAGSMKNGIHLERKAMAFSVLAEKAGLKGMIGGQAVDVEETGRPLSEEQIDFIYRLKTGALIEAPLMIGAILAGASEKAEIMENIGRNIGLAFQIQDDILDVTGTTEEIGKPVHSDEENDKTTFVTVHGVEESHKAVREYSEKALEGLEKAGINNDFLYTLVYSLINRRK